MDLIEKPSARLKSCADKSDSDRSERSKPSKVHDANAMNTGSGRSFGTVSAEFGGPDRETLAPLARMIFVLEGMRSCANDNVLSAAKDDADEMTGDYEDRATQSGPQTGWAPGVLTEIQTMFERDWTPEPIDHQSAKLFGQTIIAVNDAGSSTDHSETLQS